MRYWLGLVVTLASCSDDPPAESLEKQHCRAHSECVGGDDVDVAACTALTSGSAERARLLGCGAPLEAHQKCILRSKACIGGQFTIVRCEADGEVLGACIRSAESQRQCGAVTTTTTEDPIERLCRTDRACFCLTEISVQGCVASMRGEQAYADAYGCGVQWSDLIACRNATIRCEGNVVQYGINCDKAAQPYYECLARTSAIR